VVSDPRSLTRRNPVPPLFHLLGFHLPVSGRSASIYTCYPRLGFGFKGVSSMTTLLILHCPRCLCCWCDHGWIRLASTIERPNASHD
jgi:hypothetical protein